MRTIETKEKFGGLMEKQLKAKTKKEKSKFAIWKVVVATLCSVLGAIGIIFLGLYFSGSFSRDPVNPEGLFFADVTINEKGEKTYTSRGATPYNISADSDILISTATQGVNQNQIELSFPKGSSSYFVLKLNNGETEEDFAGSNTKFFYSKDADGNRVVYVSCIAEKATHITNGVIIVPRYVTLNTKFKVILAQEDEEGRIDFTKTFSPATKLYNVGGYTQLIAKSVSSKLTGSVSVDFNIDVPVESISIVGITGNSLSKDSVAGLNEQKLTFNGDQIEVGTEGAFSAVLNVFPFRAIYKYGKDGTKGVKEYKKVIFSLDADVNNSGPKITFADNSGNEVADVYLQEGRMFTFAGKETLGTSLLAKKITGQFNLEAKMFKSAKLEDEALKSGIGQLGDFNSVLSDPTKGLSTKQSFLIKEIPIEGFGISDEYKGEIGDDDPTKNPLTIDINNSTLIYANKPGDKSLGIKIESSQGVGQNQNKIKNILVSIQYLIGEVWYDATKTNIVGEYTIMPMYQFHVDHEIVTQNGLSISETNSLYYFNFIRPKYISASNLSYWEVWATPVAEDIEVYGISAVAIKVYYLSPDSGLVLDDAEHYGPYGIGSGASEVVQPQVEWKENDELKTSKDLGLADYNERVFVKNTVEYAKYNKISLRNLQNITNISSNPTYKTIRYFVYTNQKVRTDYVDLEQYLNVKEYNGTIPGVSGAVFEVEPTDDELLITRLDLDYIEFNLIFAVVEHEKSGTPTLHDGNYRIITVPTEVTSGNLITCPIRIYKTLGDFEITVAESKLKPYGDSDERNFFMQNQEKVIRLEITINKIDDTLFQSLAKKGDIKLIDSADIYCKIASREVALSEVLGLIFSAENPEITYEGILNKDILNKEEVEEKQKIVYSIKLSTKSLNFDADSAEKSERLSLEYKISASNMAEADKLQTKSTEFYVYSGKIRNAYFGTKGNEVTSKITVNKTIDSGKFETEISDAIAIGHDEDGYFLNVFVEGFGFADSYTVTSSNSCVVLTWIASKSRYSISFVGEGTSTLTLTLAYPHKDFTQKTLEIVVSSSYTTKAEYNANSGVDDRILSYNSVVGYQILGLANETTIRLEDLIKITAIPNGSETGTEITELFNFSLSYDNPNDFKNKVEIIEESGKIVGIKIKNSFGSSANIIVSVSSVEIGVTFQFNILVKPNVELRGTSASHAGLSSTEPDTYAVYCEADISFVNFGLYVFDLATKTYSTISSSGLHFAFYKDGKLVAIEKCATLTQTGNILNKLSFKAGSGNYTLVVSDVKEPGIFDLKKEFKFVVHSNVKLDQNPGTETKKENISYTNSSNEEIVLENVDVYNLNNEILPILNGQSIQINGNKIVFGETGIEINISRIFGGHAFDSKLFKINENDSNTEVVIKNVKSLSKQILRVSYKDVTMYVSYFVAPNITLASDYTVTYDGKTYVKLYCGQAITNATSWFKHNGVSESFTINFGSIASGRIDSLPAIYSKVGSVNLTENGTQYFVNKTSDGLIITQIVVSYSTGENREYRVFDALISPIDFDNFVTYNGSETGADWKEILAGTFVKEITSGETKEVESFLKNVNNYFGKTGSTLNYRLLRETTTGFVELSGGVAGIRRENGILKFITQPVASDSSYRIKFEYIVKSESYDDACFTFYYYIKVTKNQSIKIFYPYGSDGTTLENNAPTDSEKELFPDMTISESFETLRKHIVYFDQFLGGNYIFDLTKSANNFNSNFVKVLVGGEMQQQNTDTPSYNKLRFSIYKIFVNGVETSASAFGDYITVSDSGVVTLKKPTQTVWIMIKVSTDNGAENYYRLVVRERPSNVNVKHGTTTYTSDLVDSELAITNGFELSDLIINSAVGEVNYKIVDVNGIEQTSENMIYIEDGKIVVKSSPNSQSAYLVVYNQEFGTVAKIKVVAKSPIVVKFDQTDDIYSDNTIDLSKLLTITVDGEKITDLSSLSYSISLNGDYGFVQTPVSGYNLVVFPIANEKTVQLVINVWGEALTGTSEENPCIVSCVLNVKPRISPKQDVSKVITAGGETTISLSDLFDIQREEGTTYKYNIEMSYVWDGDVENETLTLSHEGTTTFTDDITINVSNISTKRTARLTIKVYKKDGGNVLGEVITATCTLTINPKYSVKINYPAHGTGNDNLTAEAIYINYKEEINLLERIALTGGDTSLLKFVSSNTDLIEIVDGKTGVIKIKEGASVQFNTRVFVNIYITSGLDDGKDISLGVYTIIVSPNEIKSAGYGINGSGVTYRRDTLVNTALSENENFFDVKDGWLKLETKNSTQDNFFKFTLSVREKFDHFKVPTGIKDVVIYGAGTESAGYPLLFTLNTNDGGIKSEKVSPAPTGIDKVEVLGDEPTADVCTLSEGKLTFNKAGTWIIRLTTSSGTFIYLFNSEYKNGTYVASCYKPISTDGLNRLMFESIFGTNLTNKDMYNFVIDSSTVVNVGVIKDFGLTQPETLLNFYYNLGEESYKIPYSTASELYTYSVVGNVAGGKKELREFKLEDLNPKDETTLIIFNEQGREVARYVYSIVNDFAFDEDAITEYEKTGIPGSFEENEFVGYGEKFEVSKTIELTAGTRYDLINLLKNNLGLRTFDGGEFVVENIKGKFEISLGYGYFTTNSNFKSNISALVGIVSTGDNTYEIIPHGARNNGDIVHLVLTIGGRRIILRINIVPIAKIQTLSSTGEKVISSSADPKLDYTIIKLSQLITASNVDVSKLQVAIVAGLSDGYAVSTGSSNYLIDFENGASGLDRYGIKLKKTALGGAVLKFRIFDEFGYEVADSTGTPIQIKINYRNSSGKIVEVDKYKSASSIYEGDSFDIWAKVDDFVADPKKPTELSTAYYKWDSSKFAYSKDGYKPDKTKETIMLENISDENINGISVELDYSASFKSATGADSMLPNFGVGYFSNTKFGLSQQIAGDNFVISITYKGIDQNETTGITTNTTVQQRYILKFKDTYNSYNEIYIGYTKGSTNPKNYLEVYDKKDGKITGKVFFSIENSNYWITRPEGEFVNKYLVGKDGKTRFEHEVMYKLKNNEGTVLSEGNSYSLYYCIVMDIMSMEIDSVGSYGAIIDGESGDLLLDEDDIKTASIKFKDLYGSSVSGDSFWTPDLNNKELEYYDTSILETELKGGETKYLKIYGVYEKDKQDENTLLGIVPITRAKYYALGGGGSTGISSSSLSIPFKDADGNGWGKCISAVITGNLGEDNLQAGLGGYFEYRIDSSLGKILYDETLNCYTIVLNNALSTPSGSFSVEVSYMGKRLGSFNIAVEDGKWAAFASDCLLEIDSNIVNGSISLKKFAKANEKITVTATPNVGFKFKCLIVNGKVLSDGETTFDVGINNKVVVSAKFERIEYSITKEDVKHATINLSKTKAYYGDEITVTVTPDAGYSVLAIKVNGVAISGTTFTVDGNAHVTIELLGTEYTITIDQAENGEITSEVSKSCAGETVTLTVSPSEGYNLANLEIKSDGKDVARVINGNIVTFTMPAGNVTISATFAQNVNEVKINPTENGNVFATPVNALEGAEVVLTVSPATGYKLKSLKVMFGETEIAVVNNKFTMPAGEVTISATFEVEQYTITTEGTENGTFVVSKTTANYNDEIAITITPNQGYELDKIYINGVALDNGSTTFMMPASNVTVKVTFKKIVYNLSLISVNSEAGTAEIESNTASYGDKVKISVTLETGYEIKNILINNEVGTGSWTQSDNKLVYEITMPNEDVVIMINIDKKSYKISTVNSDGGNITVSQTTAYYKDSILIEVSLKTGYRLSQITVKDAEGNSIEVNDYSFIMPASDVTISVKYAKINYNISGNISGDGNYTITNKSGSVFYNYQDTITITGTPNEGYYFNDVIIKCGSSTFHSERTSETTFDFIMPSGDVTITVVFGLNYVLGLCDVDINIDGVLTNVKTSKTSYIMPSKFYSLNNEIEYTIGDGEKCIDSDVVSIEISDGVTTINKAAFNGCTSLTKISLPDSVTSIGDSAFSGCTSLKMFTVPNGVTKISNSMFDGCKSLETIAPMENITSIGEFAFRNCEKLIRISLPEGIKVIRRFTFYGCSSLSSIRLPSSLETIQTFAFAYTGLTSIVIPNKVTALGAEEIDKQSGCVFKGCTLLTSVTLPDTFEDLGVFNFERCTALECLVLPASLKSLNTNSVGSIKALIMLGATVPTLSGTSMLYPEVYVPSSALSGYRAANKWKEYASKIHANLANLIDAPRSFDGTEYVNLGRDYMYQDKLTVEVRAYMDDWSKYTTNMRLISCTEGGGWNVGEVLAGKIHFSCYDSGNGYKNVTTSMTFADLSAGWHTFAMVFDGEYLYCYIDGKNVGVSEKYNSGKIGYHSSNAIFVGAEAAGNATTPNFSSGNFKGKIAYVRIDNSARYGLIESTTFNGSNYVNLGKDYKYTDKITAEVLAYMDDWSKYTSGMRLLSCTESGGWNVAETYNNVIHFSCYDSGNGYKSVSTNLTWADLSAGWHTFKITFDGEYLRAYIDGQLVGTSAKYTSGKIGYNASNAIFAGAEAAGNDSTPDGSSGERFKGKIAYVRIENNVS